MNWIRAYRNDRAARAIAERHYNRQSPGSPGFAPPGRVLVLLTLGGDALWVTTWPGFAQHRWLGAWMNNLFRNEGGANRVLSSLLIREAVACSRWLFGEPPALGMVTFIDPDEVRHKRDPGRCYRRAGFIDDGETEGGLLALRLPPEGMPAPARPVDPVGSQLLIEGIA